MDKSAGKGRGFAGFDPQGCVLFLRRRHPAKTARAVEAATGGRVPWRTVERWLALEAVPNTRAVGWLIVAYGPAFLAAAVPGVAWIKRAADLAEYEGMAAEIAAVQRRQARLADAMLRERS